MKAIQTEYKGYLFRSRLEARWAVFFDACGVRWEYEPEGYDLGDEAPLDAPYDSRDEAGQNDDVQGTHIFVKNPWIDYICRLQK